METASFKEVEPVRNKSIVETDINVDGHDNSPFHVLLCTPERDRFGVIVSTTI